MAILYVGIDLAKNVFAVHGVDAHGTPALVRPLVPRAKLHELIAALPPCVLGMEACSGAHHWARLVTALGHTVRLMAPKFVRSKLATTACHAGQQAQNRAQPQRLMASVTRRWRSA